MPPIAALPFGVPVAPGSSLESGIETPGILATIAMTLAMALAAWAAVGFPH
jgi:hypothetical protein